MATPATIKLHRFHRSGHSHRVQLALSLMGLPHELIDVDLKNGAHKDPSFLKMSPFGQVPTVVFDSNAILVYLAAKYDSAGRWMPRDPKGQADALLRSGGRPGRSSVRPYPRTEHQDDDRREVGRRGRSRLRRDRPTRAVLVAGWAIRQREAPKPVRRRSPPPSIPPR